MAEDVTAFIAEYKNRMKVSEERIKDLEEQNKQILSISISVEKMAITMQNMVDTMKNHSERLESIENKPIQAWTSTKKTFFTAITSAIGTAIAGGVIWLFVYMASHGAF